MVEAVKVSRRLDQKRFQAVNVNHQSGGVEDACSRFAEGSLDGSLDQTPLQFDREKDVDSHRGRSDRGAIGGGNAGASGKRLRLESLSEGEQGADKNHGRLSGARSLCRYPDGPRSQASDSFQLHFTLPVVGFVLFLIDTATALRLGFWQATVTSVAQARVGQAGGDSLATTECWEHTDIWSRSSPKSVFD